MNSDQTEESSARGIEDDEVLELKLGISRASLRAVDTCPFIDELTKLNHAPVAVLEAEYIAEIARRNDDPAIALEAERMVESAWLDHERTRSRRRDREA
jgi:hypothetical protein